MWPVSAKVCVFHQRNGRLWTRKHGDSSDCNQERHQSNCWCPEAWSLRAAAESFSRNGLRCLQKFWENWESMKCGQIMAIRTDIAIDGNSLLMHHVSWLDINCTQCSSKTSLRLSRWSHGPHPSLFCSCSTEWSGNSGIQFTLVMKPFCFLNCNENVTLRDTINENYTKAYSGSFDKKSFCLECIRQFKHQTLTPT